MPGNFGLIDLDTPQSAFTIPSYVDGSQLELIFSDEFNTDGRSFYPGDDPYWFVRGISRKDLLLIYSTHREAVDLHYWQVCCCSQSPCWRWFHPPDKQSWMVRSRSYHNQGRFFADYFVTKTDAQPWLPGWSVVHLEQILLHWRVNSDICDATWYCDMICADDIDDNGCDRRQQYRGVMACHLDDG